jgi:hypothetical protein
LQLLNFLGQLIFVVHKETNHNNSTSSFSLAQDFDANWHYPISYTFPFCL